MCYDRDLPRDVAIMQARTAADIGAVRALCLEYAATLGVDLETQHLSRELAELPGRYAPPSGCLLLATVAGRPAGCVALRALSSDVCEMKRLFVRAPHRRIGLGRRLALRILEEARARGYRAMRLDTLPERMDPAVRLYRALGFVNIPAYWNNVLPGVEYMELLLDAHG